MEGMFYGCSSLKELNLSNFNTNKVIHMEDMFSECSEQLKNKIKSEYKNLINLILLMMNIYRTSNSYQLPY